VAILVLSKSRASADFTLPASSPLRPFARKETEHSLSFPPTVLVPVSQLQVHIALHTVHLKSRHADPHRLFPVSGAFRGEDACGGDWRRFVCTKAAYPRGSYHATAFRPCASPNFSHLYEGERVQRVRDDRCLGVYLAANAKQREPVCRGRIWKFPTSVVKKGVYFRVNDYCRATKGEFPNSVADLCGKKQQRCL
jgi:hypothetical protein